MVYWALAFLVVVLIAGVFGIGGGGELTAGLE